MTSSTIIWPQQSLWTPWLFISFFLLDPVSLPSVTAVLSLGLTENKQEANARTNILPWSDEFFTLGNIFRDRREIIYFHSDEVRGCTVFCRFLFPIQYSVLTRFFLFFFVIRQQNLFSLTQLFTLFYFIISFCGAQQACTWCAEGSFRLQSAYECSLMRDLSPRISAGSWGASYAGSLPLLGGLLRSGCLVTLEFLIGEPTFFTQKMREREREIRGSCIKCWWSCQQEMLALGLEHWDLEMVRIEGWRSYIAVSLME